MSHWYHVTEQQYYSVIIITVIMQSILIRFHANVHCDKGWDHSLWLTVAIMSSMENHLVRLEVERQSNSVQTYGVNCRSRRLSLPLTTAHTT